jgi:sortase A
MLGWVRVAVGVFLVWGALGVLGYRLGWQAHSDNGQRALLRSAQTASKSAQKSRCADGAQVAPTSDGQLTGVLSMPKLGVTAPVEEGTGDAVLNVAVGHADATPLPGSAGTAVLLAHDVSYFANIDQLTAGDVVDYEIGCTTYEFQVSGHEVVGAGAPVPQLAGDALVLDTCWPTNALWYTPNRYLVEATETRVVTNGGSASQGAEPRTWTTQYSAPAPADLVAQGLDLQHNEYPMGTLSLTGSPDQAWEQSPAPLAVEAAGLEAFFGAMHAAGQNRQDWWTDLAPGVAMPPPLQGAAVSGHDAPLDVTIDAVGGTPTSIELDTDVTLSGGAAPGEYQEKVIEAVKGLTVVVGNWEVTHG